MRKTLFPLALSCAFLMTACWQNDVGRSFYASGKVRTEATVRNGLLDGPSTMFYESGAKINILPTSAVGDVLRSYSLRSRRAKRSQWMSAYLLRNMLLLPLRSC